MNKNKISAEIIADSINKQGDRITTYVLTFPRFILAQLNTHRVFSKNSASSRAIPFKTMVKIVEEDPFIPIAWQKDHKGMQGVEYITDNYEIGNERLDWLDDRDYAVKKATTRNKRGVTKQICNRTLEPFMWHKVILTATEFDNFFDLRCPQYEYEHTSEDISYFKTKNEWRTQWSHDTHDSYDMDNDNMEWFKINKGQSEIHMMELAECMYDARNKSEPVMLNDGAWHIPFGDTFDRDRLIELRHIVYDDIKRDTQQLNRHLNELKSKIATSRCARISYLNFEGKDDYQADIKLYDILSNSGHWSPFEHCAKAMTDDEYHSNIKGIIDTVQETVNWKKYYPTDESFGWCRNFKGFIQLRGLM